MAKFDEIDIRQKLEQLSQLNPTSQSEEKAVSRVREMLTAEKNKKPKTELWRKIMKSNIIKFAAAAVVITAVLLTINYFGGSIDGTTAAFGNVIGFLQTHSYTFDLTFEGVNKDSGVLPFTMTAKIMDLGRMRFDYSADMSSIANLNTGKTLLLFHQNKSGVLMEESVLKNVTGAQGIMALCSRPIASLWNLRDGTEEQLGEREIDGRKIECFRVIQKDMYFAYDIIIWSDKQKNTPYLVEIIAKPADKSFPEIKWTANNFNLDVELDESLFSLEVPAGYTLAYQSHLDDMNEKIMPSVQAEKIKKMLTLWSEGKKSEGLQVLFGINWQEPIEFGKEPYLFSMTEQGYISLNSQDQKKVMDDNMETSVFIREIVSEVIKLGQLAASNNDYMKAEHCYESGLQLGKLLSRKPDSMIISRLVGIAVKKKVLTEMIALYTAANNKEKLLSANEEFEAADAEGEAIKNKAESMTGQ